MDQQNTFCYPRSFQPQASNSLGKSFYKEKSIWEEITGQPEDHKLAKLMYKNSTILPPPTKTMQKKKKQFNESFSQLKHKLRSIFIRMRSNNDSQIVRFKENPNDVNKMHLEPQQLSSYLESYEYQAIRKFNMLIKNSKSLLRDFMYKEAKQSLDDIQSWISEVQKMMKAKYQQKARKRQEFQRLLSEYQQYSLLLQQSGMEQQTDEKDIVPYNVPQAIQFSLAQLRIEMSKITDNKQMPAAQQFENLLHKIGRDNQRDDYRNDYNV